MSGKAVRTTYPYPPTTASKRTYDRSVIVKVSYKTFRKGNVSAEMKQRIQTNTAECIEYFLRFEDSLAFNEKYTGLTKEELREQFKDDAVFKIMVSPEDPEILTENYIRKIVSFIELHTRHHLKWAAVFHDNTEHPHAHIMISRTSAPAARVRSAGSGNQISSQIATPKRVPRTSNTSGSLPGVK